MLICAEKDKKLRTSDNIGVQCFVHRIKGLISCCSMSDQLRDKTEFFLFDTSKNQHGPFLIGACLRLQFQINIVGLGKTTKNLVS